MLRRKSAGENKVQWRSATGAWGERFWTSLPRDDAGGQGAVRSTDRAVVSGDEADTSTSTGTQASPSLSSSSSALMQRTPSSKPEPSQTEDPPLSTTTTTTTVTPSPPPTSPTSALQARSFPKPYFSATLLGYLSGLIATILSMQIMGRAQPALLYLVPGVVGALWGCAVLRREGRVLWGFSEGEGKEGEGEGKEEKPKQRHVEEVQKPEITTTEAAQDAGER